MTGDVVGTPMLPCEAYLSESSFVRDLDLFVSGWVFVARTTDVPNPGDYAAVDIAGRALVIARDLEGRIRVLSRVCAHRRMEVVEGTGNARIFKCPYHGWRYDLSGALLSAPLADKSALEGCELAEVPSEVWSGFVFVNLDGEAGLLAHDLQALRPILMAYGVESYSTVYSERLAACPWNWKLSVENFIECYHHVGLHAQSLGREFPTRLSYVDGDSSCRTCTVIRSPQVGGMALPGVDANRSRSGLLIVAIYPSLLLSVGNGSMIWVAVHPTGPESTDVSFAVTVSPKTAEAPDSQQHAARLLEDVERVLAEDLRACESVQRGIRGAVGSGPAILCSEFDAPLAHFYAYLADAHQSPGRK